MIWNALNLAGTVAIGCVVAIFVSITIMSIWEVLSGKVKKESEGKSGE